MSDKKTGESDMEEGSGNTISASEAEMAVEFVQASETSKNDSAAKTETEDLVRTEREYFDVYCELSLLMEKRRYVN